jgi:hypothetical protein
VGLVKEALITSRLLHSRARARHPLSFRRCPVLRAAIKANLTHPLQPRFPQSATTL